jgi:hypothetical protein
MTPLYLAKIEDLGQGDFVKVDCPTCHHVALLTPGSLLKLGLNPATKVSTAGHAPGAEDAERVDEPSCR